MQQIALRLFDVDLLVETNDPKLSQLFHQLYSEMMVAPKEVRPSVRRSHFIRSATTTILQVGDSAWHLPTPYPKFAHNLIWYDAVQHIRSHLLLHAAGIAYNGNGALLVGYSMSGKTTLSLALMQRGAQLLTDDAIAIDYAKGELCALARQVQVRPKTRQLLNLLTDPKITPSPPYPLKHLFILDNQTAQPPAQFLMDVQVVPLAWQQGLKALSCVDKFNIAQVDTGWWRCHLHLNQPAAQCYPLLEQLCVQHNVLIYDVQSNEERTPHFADVASFRPIPPSQAAFQLLPHIQNRTLAQQFGDEIPLYTTILHLIKDTICYQLQVGTPSDTSRKLIELLNRS